jgi:hypothetical protein
MKKLKIRRFWISAFLFGFLMSAIAGQQSDKLVLQGDEFCSKGKMTEALWAYRQAARAGNVNGAFAAGDLLLSQGKSGNSREQMLKLSEAYGYLFFAATNRNPRACAKLADTLQKGTGIPASLVCAYAWMEIAAKYDPAFRTNLDRMVVGLEPHDILKAQKLARDYISGHWPGYLARSIDQGDPRFQIQGMSVMGQKTLVIVNGDSLSVGDSVNVTPAGTKDHPGESKLLVSCLGIGNDYALVAVAGEPNLKMLPIGSR